jgi:dipeptidyl aminopeptidase/acylaminoacyl peptidase
LIKPINFDPNKKYPLLLFIHGGPYVSFRDRFSYRFNPQPYVNEGYIALRVNSRGSTGFGQKFIEENKGKWGDLGYKDIISAIDDICKESYVDENKLAALGTSYGGYMVNWIASQKETAERFKCFVSFAGIYNLTSFYGTTDLSHKYEHEFDGTPFDNPEPYKKWSPATYAKNMKTPMLIVHGGCDYRVSYSESLQLYTALSRQNIDCEMLYFKEESHWIMKPNNYILFYETVLRWLHKYLG